MAEGNGKQTTADALRERAAVLKYYGGRAVDETFNIGPWAITIRALPTGVANYIDSLGDFGARRFEFIRFGVVGWQGLETNTGEAIPFKAAKAVIYGKQYDVVDRDLMDLIPPPCLEVIYLCIVELSCLSWEEQQSLDFTAPSADGDATADGTAGQSVTNAAGEASC